MDSWIAKCATTNTAATITIVTVIVVIVILIITEVQSCNNNGRTNDGGNCLIEWWQYIIGSLALYIYRIV